MADYFAALAERTLRPEPSVQPRQRVPWEVVAEPVSDVLPATETRIADGAPPSVWDEGEPPRRSRRKLATESNPRESEPVERRLGRERGRRKRASDRADLHAAAASTPHPTVRAVEPTVQVRFERVAARPGDPPGNRPGIASERAGAAARTSGVERARPLSTRLSARERESTAEPAIRIHINRVDVRAVTTAAPGSSAPASRPGQHGLMSLDEYVQKRDRGVS
jgi:hypothetical protein